MAKANKKIKNKTAEKDFSWVIAYVDISHLDRVYKELGRCIEYREIEAYIPTVKILKKTFKGQNYFEDVPLLFNYGFFKIPRKYCLSKTFLDDLKTNISCISGWVQNIAKVNPSHIDKKATITDRNIYYGTATPEEIKALVEMAYLSSLYDKDDINQLRPGMVIKLVGYPFEGSEVEVVEVIAAKHIVKVKMQMFNVEKVVEVSFDNVFFTIYRNKGYDDTVTLAQSLELNDVNGLNKNMDDVKDAK